MQRWATSLLCAGLACMLSGCRHKVVVPQLPKILAPVELADVPEPQLPMIETPQVKMPPMPIAAAAAHPHREHRRSVAKVAPQTTPPAQTEQPSAPTDAAAIGELSTGGDSNPRNQQEAAEMIASIDKRLNSLSAQVAEEQKSQVSKVKNFQKQAQDALGSGDVEGAKTLATKARLILDDIEK